MKEMGEIKSVKVDNWGVFFLQKLQNFFNKTDYCDMTLQFNDNSQLKVHRLVLSACTDYFNLLETNCELIDDALVMPNDLQADVVVPIVNFMYTGTLEFELNMYNKLLRTARDMNMTVLLKLLEAHRRTMEQSTAINKPQQATTQLRGRPYQTTLSPTKQVTIQRGTMSTQSPGGRIITSNISRQPAAIQRRNIAIKEEVSYDPSPFEQLRQSGVNYKRPASKAYETPPEKKPSIEDVKEFAEQQRMRKQIAAAEISGITGEDEYVESYMEEEFPQDDEEEELNISGSQITIKQEPNQKPTIVFKASADSKMDHAKIIGEVLKKYPHLIKNNKNLKLKIMPNSGTTQTQKIVVKKEEDEVPQKPIAQPSTRTATSNTVTQKPLGQPKKIDSKTMHSLIALGAENTTGPWLCLRCGVNGRPISIPSYRGFRRHLINTHREKIDAKLCEHCGYRSSDVRDLHFHVQVDHQITSTSFTFPRCEYCAQFFVTNTVLHKHIEESHTKNQQCIYCNEVYPKENDLYNHMKLVHKKQAQSDGVIDFSDGEEVEENEFLTFNKVEDSKIKILSDISLPTTSVALTEGTKFVTADGNEMVLSEEQRDQLMAQLDPNQEGGGIIMVLNESFNVPAEQQQSVEHVVGMEQVQLHEQSVEEKHEPENLFEYKDEETEEEQLERKIQEQLDDDEELDGGGDDNDKVDEKREEQAEAEEKMDADEEDEEKQRQAEDEKLKMITGEWTDDEPEEEQPQEDDVDTHDTKQDQTIAEEIVEEKSEEKEKILDDSEIKEEKDDSENLASPLKQELMEFLGMDNIEETILDDKVSDDKKPEAKSNDNQKEEVDIKEAEEVLEPVEEKSTAEEVEDELAQLREEIEATNKDEPEEEIEEDKKEDESVQEAEPKEVSESEIQEQLETTEEKIEESLPQEPLVEEKAEVKQEETEPQEEGEQNEQSKDALKSIITDWADEAEGQDDAL